MKTWTTPKGTELPLLDFKGKPYLQVAHRIVWFREDHPNGSIQTFIVDRGTDWALFRAEIRNEAGTLLAWAHKHENAKGFQDYLEKSETGAIGRALTLCGYGTQFCSEELDEGERLADSPTTPAKLISQDRPTSTKKKDTFLP